MDNNDLLYLSGNDIPFIEAQIIIHQPTIKEVAYIGEEAFFTGCELINFSKNNLSEEDKNNLENQTNFDILIAILRERNAVMQRNRNCVEMVLALIFPEYSIEITEKEILFKKEEEEEAHSINNENFEQFKKIFNKMFNFEKNIEEEYNPSGDMAQRIVEKLNKRHQILSAKKGAERKKIDVLARYLSILAVGQHKDLNSLLQYTVYQLYDEFERYRLKLDYDIYFKASLAGAKDLKEVEDWMKDIHS